MIRSRPTRSWASALAVWIRAKQTPVLWKRIGSADEEFDFFENVLESARAGDVYHALIVTPFRCLRKSSLFWP